MCISILWIDQKTGMKSLLFLTSTVHNTVFKVMSVGGREEKRAGISTAQRHLNHHHLCLYLSYKPRLKKDIHTSHTYPFLSIYVKQTKKGRERESPCTPLLLPFHLYTHHQSNPNQSAPSELLKDALSTLSNSLTATSVTDEFGYIII